MTTIVIDCENQKVYADDLTTCTRWTTNFFEQKDQEWLFYKDGKQKAYKKNGVIITGSGAALQIQQFANSYPDNVCEPFDSNTNIFVVMPKEDSVQVIKFHAVKKSRFRKKLKWVNESWVQSSGYVTSGSGKVYAQGALAAGVHPKDAIIAASKIDSSTGSRVNCFEFDSEEL